MFIPEVVKVSPKENYIVDVMFQDGKVTHYDVKPLLNKGVFKVLNDKDFYFSRCTVMNHTLAWDVSGNCDEKKCIDIDPETLYEN